MRPTKPTEPDPEILPPKPTLFDLRTWLETQSHLLPEECDLPRADVLAFITGAGCMPTADGMTWTGKRIVALCGLARQGGRDAIMADRWLKRAAVMLAQTAPKLAKALQLDIEAGTCRIIKPTIIVASGPSARDLAERN